MRKSKRGDLLELLAHKAVDEASSEVSYRLLTVLAIRRWLSIKGLTVSKLAEQVDLTPGYLTTVLSGQRGVSMELVWRIEQALGVKILGIDVPTVVNKVMKDEGLSL